MGWCLIVMYVILSFLKKIEPRQVTEMFWGDYSSVDIILVDNQNITMYRTRPGETFLSHPLRKDTMVNLEYFTQQSQFLQIEVTGEEFQKLSKTCATFATVGKPFNRRDYLLHYMPIRIPEDIPLFQVKTLSDSQAVILFLRECLSPGHRLSPIIQTLNSRHVLPETLYHAFFPFSCPLDWTGLCPLLPWSA